MSDVLEQQNQWCKKCKTKKKNRISTEVSSKIEDYVYIYPL